jgi:hypothetical protein
MIGKDVCMDLVMIKIHTPKNTNTFTNDTKLY